MEIFFIITCFDKEHYIPHLLNIIHKYKKIIGIPIVCYNGTNENFKCDFKCKNTGLNPGDLELTLGGYNISRYKSEQFPYNINKKYFRIIKLSCDTWLLNEHVIIDIFKKIENNKCCYGGCVWHYLGLPTDCFFVDLRFGNIFNKLKNKNICFEHLMFQAVNLTGIPYIIPEKVGSNYECKSLNLCSFHNLNNNLNAVKKWNVSRISFI